MTLQLDFGQSGSLLVRPTKGANFVNVQYNDKTINQFLGVTGITTDLVFGADILENKLKRAINYCNTKFPAYESVVVAGGVAANVYLRKRLQN